jgi:hypothetical protein
MIMPTRKWWTVIPCTYEQQIIIIENPRSLTRHSVRSFDTTTTTTSTTQIVSEQRRRVKRYHPAAVDCRSVDVPIDYSIVGDARRESAGCSIVYDVDRRWKTTTKIVDGLTSLAIVQHKKEAVVLLTSTKRRNGRIQHQHHGN